MEKRILIAFVLSFAVLYGFKFIFPPPPEPPVQPPTETTAPAGVASAPVPAPAPSGEGAVPSEEIRAAEPMELPVEGKLYTVVLNNTGGVLKSFRLKSERYLDERGRSLELIDQAVSSLAGWPLAIVSGDTGLDQQLATANYVMQETGPAGGEHAVTMEFASGGIHAKKTLRFTDDQYRMEIATSLTRNGSPIPHQVVWQGGFGDQTIPADPAYQHAIHIEGTKFKRIALKSIAEPQDFTTALAGVEDRYFLAMFLAPRDVVARVGKTDFNQPDGTASTAMRVGVPGGEEPVGIYVGPKHDGILASVDPRLEAVPNYGWFGFITKPLITALVWIHDYIGNFGWAIVILTIVINAVLFPFRVKQQLAMLRMQKLAPHMKALQEKYKKLKAGDPKRTEVEAELMQMNKEQLSGCLPSLLQMPLLFAFWNMLSVSIELRGAPWILWVHDLSRADPYYILPILMSLSMFISQKMTPTTADPAQAKMMLIMPFVLLIMLLWAQSGVALYWLTSNVVGIGQQYFIRKHWADGAVAAAPVRQRKPAQGN